MIPSLGMGHLQVVSEHFPAWLEKERERKWGRGRRKRKSWREGSKEGRM